MPATSISVPTPNIGMAAPIVRSRDPLHRIAAPNIRITARYIRIAAPYNRTSTPYVRIAAPNIRGRNPWHRMPHPDVRIGVVGVERPVPAERPETADADSDHSTSPYSSPHGTSRKPGCQAKTAAGGRSPEPRARGLRPGHPERLTLSWEPQLPWRRATASAVLGAAVAAQAGMRSLLPGQHC